MKNLICVSLYDNLSIKVYNLSEVYTFRKDVPSDPKEHIT